MSEYYGVSTPTEDFISHYGVKGMKWGVRKAIKDALAKKLLQDNKSTSVSVDKPQITINKTVVKNKTKNVYKNGRNERGLTPKQEALRKEWAKTSAAERAALADRNKGFIISPKKNRAYEAAKQANYAAADRFFNSMTDEERKRYHDKYLW